MATKKQLQNTQVKKVRLQKNQFKKKTPCHDTVRLRLGWCLLDVVVTWSIYRRLQHSLHVVATSDVQQLQKHDSCKTRMWVIACTLIAV
jgi:hypothetical protein